VWVIAGLIVGALFRVVAFFLGWRLPMAPRGLGIRHTRTTPLDNDPEQDETA